MHRFHRVRPERVFLTIAAVAAFVSTLAFTITPFYRFQVAGLDDLELVLAGTVMEAAVFLFEIPTGIVADLWSRKWSVIVGHVGMGVGLLIEASVASTAGVLTGQVVWGIAYTFTSGATVAWVSAELDDPDRPALTKLFLKASRRGSAAALLAMPLAFVLAGGSLRVPIIVAGATSIALGLWLIAAMSERRVTRTEHRPTWAAMACTGRQGMRAMRGSHVLIALAAAIFLAGGASEAYDRYVDKYLLVDLGPPAWPGWSPLTWMAVVACTSALLGILVPWWFERRRGELDNDQQRRWIVGLILAQVVALIAMVVTGSFLVAAAASLVVDRLRSLKSGLLSAWLVPLTPRHQRATVLSTLEQTDSISQVMVGPLLGAVGRAFGIRRAGRQRRRARTVGRGRGSDSPAWHSAAMSVARRAVVLFVPEPVAGLVDDVRRRWDPVMLGRIDAHVTLVHDVVDSAGKTPTVHNGWSRRQLRRPRRLRSRSPQRTAGRAPPTACTSTSTTQPAASRPCTRSSPRWSHRRGPALGSVRT